jgi:hypothetical protein
MTWHVPDRQRKCVVDKLMYEFSWKIGGMYSKTVDLGKSSEGVLAKVRLLLLTVGSTI